MPLPLVIAGMALSAGGGIFSGLRGRSSGRRQATILNEQADRLEAIYRQRESLLRQDAQDAEDVAEFNAKAAYVDANSVSAVAEFNAKSSEMEATALRLDAKAEAARMYDATERALGFASARYGSSGVQMAGSASQVLNDSYANAKLNIHNMLRTASSEITKYMRAGALTRVEGQLQSQKFKNEAAMIKMMGGLQKKRFESQADIERETGIAEALRIRDSAYFANRSGTDTMISSMLGGASDAVGIASMGIK